MFSLESPHRWHSNECKQYTSFNSKKEKHPKLLQICSYRSFSKGLKEFETAMVNKPSAFEALKFYCTCTKGIWEVATVAENQVDFSHHKSLFQVQCSYRIFSKGLKEFETAMVNKPTAFEALKFYCTCTKGIWEVATVAENQVDFSHHKSLFQVQSTLVISNLKGPSKTLRDIHTSTYQFFRTEENTNRTTKFQK